MHLEKALGPDRYNTLFYQANWKTIGKAVTVVQSFFATGKLLKAINHTFVTLIRKTLSPSSSVDYIPISCCNVLYKIITKVINKHVIRY